MVKSEPDVIELNKRRLNVKPKVKTKPNIEPNKKHEQDVHWALPFEHSLEGAQYKPNIEFHGESKPDTNKITIEPSLVELNNYEEEKVALILGTTGVFTVWWMFK